MQRWQWQHRRSVPSTNKWLQKTKCVRSIWQCPIVIRGTICSQSDSAEQVTCQSMFPCWAIKFFSEEVDTTAIQATSRDLLPKMKYTTLKPVPSNQLHLAPPDRACRDHQQVPHSGRTPSGMLLERTPLGAYSKIKLYSLGSIEDIEFYGITPYATHRTYLAFAS
jgi:hypothetical protein